jgi:Tetrapyrrole (Corrin/Porphyrin) Methylases
MLGPQKRRFSQGLCEPLGAERFDETLNPEFHLASSGREHLRCASPGREHLRCASLGRERCASPGREHLRCASSGRKHLRCASLDRERRASPGRKHLRCASPSREHLRCAAATTIGTCFPAWFAISKIGKRDRKDRQSPMKKGSLIIVGTGIRSVGQLTVESIAWIQRADKVFYVVSDPIGESLILQLNPSAESLRKYYVHGKPRLQTYNDFVDRIMESVRDGNRTCAAFYGHPGVFVTPSHEAVRQARSEGYKAWMLPGISAEDCLFADLGVDPSTSGCQAYEATDFVIHQRRIDPTTSVILWQVGIIGEWTFQPTGYANSGLPLLLEKLTEYYQPDHGVFVYEAAVLPGCEPLIRPVPLCQLTSVPLTTASTLYIPPAQSALADRNMYERLGLPI